LPAKKIFPPRISAWHLFWTLARVLKVARTIADLAAADRIGPTHVAEAIYC